MGCDFETAYVRLKLIEVRAIDEAGIEQQVRWGIAVRFLGDATNVVDELRTILEDSVHRTITRDGLIDRLAAGGLITRRSARIQQGR